MSSEAVDIISIEDDLLTDKELEEFDYYLGIAKKIVKLPPEQREKAINTFILTSAETT